MQLLNCKCATLTENNVLILSFYRPCCSIYLACFVLQGPVEVATVFLNDVVEGRITPTRHHNKLRLCFKNFLKK